MSNRFFENKLKDYDSNENIFFDANHQITPQFNNRIDAAIANILHVFKSRMGETANYDYSIYAGNAGIALFLWKLNSYTNSNTNAKFMSDSNWNSSMQHLVNSILPHSSKHNNMSSFVCGKMGILAVSTLLNVNNSASECVQQICGMPNKVERDFPNEILYGRAGYLYGLIFLIKSGRVANIPHNLILHMTQSIIESGLETAKKNAEKIYRVCSKICPMKISRSDLPPLYYEWYNEPYLGAAHGFSGILTILLQIYLDNTFANIRANMESWTRDYVKPTIDFMLRLKMPSGNFPPTLTDSIDEDRLVHWCHGAPGWIAMLINAHKVYNEDKYLSAALEAAEVVWNRGLLTKGCGLCHGTAGNGYAFISIFRHTKNPKYLYRACKFAEWSFDCFKNAIKEADRPLSLFEGVAGTLWYLLDMKNPTSAMFPCLEF